MDRALILIEKIKDIKTVGKGIPVKQAVSISRRQQRGSGFKLTLNDLIRITNKRGRAVLKKRNAAGFRHGLGEFRQVRLRRTAGVKADPEAETVRFDGVAFGEENYNVTIKCFNVGFSDSPDKEHTIQVRTISGTSSFIKKIDRRFNPVEVKCTCKDFNFTASFWNKKQNTLFGRVRPEIKNFKANGDGLKRNTKHISVMCKHVFQFIPQLQAGGFVN